MFSVTHPYWKTLLTTIFTPPCRSKAWVARLTPTTGYRGCQGCSEWARPPGWWVWWEGGTPPLPTLHPPLHFLTLLVQEGLVHTNPSPKLTPPHTRSAHTPEGGLSAVLTSPHTEGEAWGGSSQHQPTHNHNLLSAAKHHPQEVKLSRGVSHGLRRLWVKCSRGR